MSSGTLNGNVVIPGEVVGPTKLCIVQGKEGSNGPFDVGTGDPIIPEPSLTQTPSLIIPESTLSWMVYPVERIIAEKMHVLVAHGDLNSRSKDAYDLVVYGVSIGQFLFIKRIIDIHGICEYG